MGEKSTETVIIGNSTLIIPCGEYLLDNGFKILAVVTSDAEVKKWCSSGKIPVIQEADIHEVKKMEFDYLFSIVYLKVLPVEITKKPKKAAINYHDALLPAYAGIHATSWAIMNGEKKHGITWHVMEEKLDTGNILVQKEIEIEDGETAVSLNIKCFQVAIEGFYELIDSIISGSLVGFQQNIANRSYYGKWKKPRQASLINWNQKTGDILRFVRSLDFGEYDNTLAVPKITYKGKYYIVEEISKSKKSEMKRESSFAIEQDGTLVVSAKDGVLEIHRLCDLEGKEVSISQLFSDEKNFFSLKPDEGTVETLQECIMALVKQEPYWVKKYECYSMDSEVWNRVLHHEIRKESHKNIWSNLTDLTLVEKLLLSIAAELTACDISTRQYVGYCDTSFDGYSLCEEVVPFCLKLEKPEQIVSNVKLELQQIKKHISFSKDIFYRYKIINNRHVTPYIAIYLTDTVVEHTVSRINFVVNEKLGTITFSCCDESTRIFAECIMKRLNNKEGEEVNSDMHQRKIEFRTVYQLIQEQIEKRKDKIAIISDRTQISYRELGNRIDKRVALFYQGGIRKGMNVGVLLHRNHEVLISFLALQKIGAIYIPMDATYPVERLDFMAEDAQISHFVTESNMSIQLTKTDFQTLYIDREEGLESITLEAAELSASDPVYILYTSGSTGKPKGVIVNHLGLSNFLLSMQKEPGFTEQDILLSVTTVCFDISGLELYLPLISGGITNILSSDITNDGVILREAIEASNATVIQATPATWNMLIMAGWEKKLPIKILCGGESLTIELADKLLKQCDELWNMYGPTETTIWSTIKQITDKNCINIGKPIDNTQIWIFDKNMKQVQGSQSGELYIGGYGVANGYYKREDLTAERFIENPLKQGDRIYRTGDLAKINSAGDLIYLGRVDNQVKFHGFRIELEEIERVIQEKLDLKKAIVVMRKDDLNEDALFAFLQSDKECNREEDIEKLREFLPHYMIPSEFIRIQEYPLTANKKINRKYLATLPISTILGKYNILKEQKKSLEPTPEKILNKNDSQKPKERTLERSYYVEDIKKVAAEVLKKDPSFFSEDMNLGRYGFNSLRYTVFSTKLNKKLGVKVTPAICYKYKTIGELSAYLAGNAGGETITVAAKKEESFVTIPDTNKVSPDIKDKLRNIAATIVKKPVDTLRADKPLSTYGFNSVRYTVFCTKVNKELQVKITPALCYRYKTIDDLSNYLIQNVDQGVKESFNKAEEPSKKVEEQFKKAEQPIRADEDDIAIIGVGLRMPQADSTEAYWNIIREGTCVVGNIPKDRWDCDEYKQYDKDYPDYGAFMKDIWSFDASFFHLSPREALQMDPQQRIFLETSWEAIEDAGYNPETLAGDNISVYVGSVESDYYNRLSRNMDQADIFTISGNIQCGIANRVSYLLDFHGESETINTACSSSLVAIHHAVNALRSGECSMALAGGINVILNPFMHYALKQNGMLSPDGRCRAFDSRANGYVRGEGCGVILLKPVKQAYQDGDHIYALIKGSAVNHDGMTNSFTAPNPVMQTELIKEAYKKNNIRADCLSYIETHGTGTKLGDPIEVNALKDAFENMYQDNIVQKGEQYCALGSVKANIGHLEAAAGIASILKIILQMQHKVIPKVAELEEVNPYIETQKSPFYIPKENRKWEGITDENGHKRWIAGVSSFGFGGTNAHIILEAVKEQEETKTGLLGECMFPISHETEDGLQRYVQKMTEYIKEEQKINGERHFTNIAGVLQGGRKSCQHRVAFIAKSMSQLLCKMKAFLHGESQEGILVGEKDGSKVLDILLDGQDGNEYISYLYEKKKIRKIAQLWVLGAEIEWNKIGNQASLKVSVPTYQFAQETYRLDSIDHYEDKHGTKNSNAVDTVLEKKFSINPNTPYIKEHVIDGTCIFPGVKFIEMGIQSCLGSHDYPVSLTGNEWVTAKPVKKEDVLFVETRPDGEWIQYRIFSESSGKRVLHARGKAKNTLISDSTKEINIKRILEACHHSITKGQIYDKYRNYGFSYGKIYQPVESINYSENEFLSKIRLTQDMGDEYEKDIRLIRLFEGGMQAVIASFASDEGTLRFVPVGISKCIIYHLPITLDAYGYARLVKSSETEHVITKEFDIEITDCTGKILIQLLGYTLKVHRMDRKKTDSSNSLTVFAQTYKETEAGLFSRDQRDRKVLIIKNQRKNFQEAVNYISTNYNCDIVTDITDHDMELLKEKVSWVDSILVFDNGENESYSLLLGVAKACIQSHRNIRILYVYKRIDGADSCFEEASRGFANCYQNESMKSFLKIMEVDNDVRYNSEIEQELFCGDNSFVTYRNGKRLLEGYEKVTGNDNAELIRDKFGCYLITGGTGCIGIALADQIRKSYPEAKLVLVGKKKTKQIVADKLVSYDENNVLVSQADIADEAQVRELLIQVHSRFGTIKGLFHAAGTIDDAYIAEKQLKDATKVINAKVQGIRNLDFCLKEENLDFVVLFSSISTITGNAGQSDYCYANAYLNAFASYRNSLVKEGVRKGTTISINWGLWKEGGMKLGDAELELLRKRNGILPLQTEEGIHLLLSSGNYSGVIYAAKMEQEILLQRLNQLDLKEITLKATEPVSTVSDMEKNNINEQLNHVLRECCSKVIQLDVQKIILNKELSEYGFDSLTNTELANEINKKLNIDITPVTFFEYTNLSDLSDYLKKTYAQELSGVFTDLKQTQDCEQVLEDKIESSKISLASNLSYVQGHTVFEQPVILGVTYISHFAECLQNQTLVNGEFQNILFQEAVTVLQNCPISYEVTQKQTKDRIAFTETCELTGKSVIVATGTFRMGQSTIPWEQEVVEELQRTGREVNGTYIYQHKWCNDVQYQKELQSVEKLWIGDNVVLGRIVLHPEVKGLFSLNPAVLDGAMICGLYAFLENVKESYIPYMIKKAAIRKNVSDTCYCICRKNRLTEEILSMDISILAEDGSVACYMKEFICKKVSNAEHFNSTKKDTMNSKTTGMEKDVAIIGMSASFAGGRSIEQYWNSLVEKKDCIKEIPLDHFDYREFYDPDSHGDDKMYTKWGGFIENVDKFDASFFHISRREAEVMDPQLRLLLQHIYHAAEDAGYAGTLRGSNTGMYVGCCFHDYQQKMDRRQFAVTPHDLTGNAMTMLANRPSYCLDLKGPSVNVDTACSSSLVALHLACQGLLHNECDMAFVGGVNLLLDSWHYRYFCSIGALSKSGRCHTFSDEADGYIPGEGVAVLVLKPFQKAVQDNDNIYGVIKGSAINHGGMTTSVTAPDLGQEAKVIRAAWKDAGVSGENISYIEAHGTGTKLGDPIEINALKRVFEDTKDKNQTCYVGTAKASIGHTEGAAGLAGVIKVLLSMKYKMLPAMPVFDRINPYINLKESNLCINKNVIKWQPVKGSRMAGISSFGAGGAYAHVVLEEYEQPKPKSAVKRKRLILISAKKEESLKLYLKSLLVYLKEQQIDKQQEEETWLRDIAYSLMVGREQMNLRLTFCVNEIRELIEKIEKVINGAMGECMFQKLTDDNILSKGKMSEIQDIDRIARLWIDGYTIETEQIEALYDTPSRIPLPGYVFEEKSFWVEPIQKEHGKFVGKKDFFIKNHVVNNRNIMPGVAYLDYVLKAAREKGIAVKSLCDLCFIAPLNIEDSSIEIKVKIGEDNSFIIGSWDGTRTQHHVQGIIESEHTITSDIKEDEFSNLDYTISSQDFYEELRDNGLCIGKPFQSVKKLQYDKLKVKADIVLSEELKNTLDDFVLHPAVLDGVLQAVISRDNDSCLHIPFEIREINLSGTLSERVVAYGRKDEITGKWDIKVSDTKNEMLLSIKGLVSKSVQTDDSQQSNQEDWLVNMLTKLNKNELTVKDVENML